MLGWLLRVPWPFVSGTPPHLKKEWFHDWLRMKNSLSSQVTIFLTLSLTLSLSSNTYIVCRETESIEWPQKETPFTSRQLGRPSVQPASLLMDGFLCEAWGEASSAPSLRKRKTINLSCEHCYCSVLPCSISLWPIYSYIFLLDGFVGFWVDAICIFGNALPGAWIRASLKRGSLECRGGQRSRTNV